MAVLAMLRRQWGRLPEGVRQPVVRTGLPYVANFLARYGERHRIANFAGNLEALKGTYADSRPESRAELSRQFDAVVDALVMPNDVKKTTYANRVTRSLSAVLSAVRLPGPEIRVLDLPASTGIASLQSLTFLQERYRVASYVLGDKYHKILYDPRHRCVFDEQGNLLQVAFRNYYFSIHRGHVSGDEHTFLSSCLLFPHGLMAWYLRKRYRFRREAEYRQLLVVHPEVEKLLGQGILELREMDIFQPIPGCYELILSFNLLQRNYFPPQTIKAGVDNLAASLREGGVLIMGNTDAFLALQKRDGALIPCLQEGSF